MIAFQYSSRLGAIIGGLYPNHCTDVHQTSIEEINIILKDCIDGKYGPMADEVKVAVVSFQNTPGNVSISCSGWEYSDNQCK